MPRRAVRAWREGRALPGVGQAGRPALLGREELARRELEVLALVAPYGGYNVIE